MRDVTRHVKRAQELVQTVVYHVQKTWFKIEAQADVAQFVHKDNFQPKENAASVIQIAKVAMVQAAPTASTVPRAKRSTILLV